MTAFIRTFLQNRAGVTSIEYAILATMIAIVAVVGLTGIGLKLSGEFSQVSSMYK